MDVTGLSVSIDVDMTGFIEAMEEVIALLKTVADELMAAELRSQNVFDGITKSSEKAVVSIEDVLDLLEDVAGICKDILELDTGDMFSVVSLAIDLTKFGADMKKTYDDANKSIQDTTKNVKELNNVQNNTTEAKKDGGDGNTWTNPNSKNGLLIDASSLNGEADMGNTGAGNPPDINKSFMEDYQKNLDMVKKMADSQKAVITVNADAIAATSGQTNILNQNIVNTTNNLIKQGDAAKQSANAMKMLGDIGTDAVGGIFEALGKMAGGEKVNPLVSIMKTLGENIKKLGMGLISTGLPMLVNPITAAQGALQVGEGGALVAAAGALSTIKMASGGLVSGSSFVNVGEYAGASHNPEVIAPLDKLQGIMGSQGTQHHIFRIQGDSFVTGLDRIDNNTQFTIGKG